ncbi:hypothetical protein [Agrococcus sp. KRD186]|uniref:hypothetical protein n=1 Tax=Agrococcus sp. KRD186 TaxID=2729730 RepID=UPI0019D2CE1B|nr:hypothetical protein [Agrococcus sp. KRD186]
MTIRRALLPAAAALLLVTLLAGCATAAPADSVPPAPAAAAPQPSAGEAGAASPPDSPAASAPAEQASEWVDWARFEVGDGHTSWSLPPGWTAEIERQVVEGNAEWTDYEGLVRDAAGTPMLQFIAIASGGQYGTDFSPCERPQTEVFESLPLGEQVAGGTAHAVTLAHVGGDGRVTLSAGVSTNDPEASCEPGILALYPEQYDFLLLQIVADDGMNPPTFVGFDEARAYLDTEEYAAIRGVLASFEYR